MNATAIQSVKQVVRPILLLGSMVDTMNNEINGEASKHEARCAKHGGNN